jgi:hypothetical protein
MDIKRSVKSSALVPLIERSINRQLSDFLKPRVKLA